jgi:hypothetical protein
MPAVLRAAAVMSQQNEPKSYLSPHDFSHVAVRVEVRVHLARATYF